MTACGARAVICPSGVFGQGVGLIADFRKKYFCSHYPKIDLDLFASADSDARLGTRKVASALRHMHPMRCILIDEISSQTAVRDPGIDRSQQCRGRPVLDRALPRWPAEGVQLRPPPDPARWWEKAQIVAPGGFMVRGNHSTLSAIVQAAR